MTSVRQAAKNDFNSQFCGLLTAMGKKLEDFSPHTEEGLKAQECRGNPFSKSVLYPLLSLSYPFSFKTAQRIAARLECFLDATPREVLLQGLRELRRTQNVQISFVRFKGTRVRVDIPALMRLYESSRELSAYDDTSRPAAEDIVEIALTIPELPEEVTDDRIAQLARMLGPELIGRLAQRVGLEVFRLDPSCTTVSIRMSREMAEELLDAFDSGRLDKAGIVGISLSQLPNRSSASFASSAVRPSDPEYIEKFSKSWKSAAHKLATRQPWERLRWLFSRRVRYSPLAESIAESGGRAYATPGLYGRRKSLRVDLTMTFVIWPLLTMLLLLATLAPLKFLFPFIAVKAGVISGLALSLAGAQVCAAIVSPIATGAGGVVMGWAFGLAQAFAIGKFGIGKHTLMSAATIRKDMFLAVTGGPVGMSASAWWAGFPHPLVLVLLAFIAASIALAGWLMGQPERASLPWQPTTSAAWTLGVPASLAAGSCIGLIYGLKILLSAVPGTDTSSPIPFIAALAIVGGTVFGATVWLYRREVRAAVLFGLAHAFVSILLCFALGRIDGAALLALLAATTGWYQATWFTAAYALGLKLGSVNAALVATTLEGALGFTTFIVIRMLQAPA